MYYDTVAIIAPSCGEHFTCLTECLCPTKTLIGSFVLRRSHTFTELSCDAVIICSLYLWKSHEKISAAWADTVIILEFALLMSQRENIPSSEQDAKIFSLANKDTSKGK